MANHKISAIMRFENIRIDGVQTPVSEVLSTFSHDSSPEWRKDIANFLIKWNEEGEEMEMYSSGSTGVPKLVRLKKSMMVDSARRTAVFFNFKAKQKVLHALPSKFIGGAMMILRALMYDMDIYFRAPKSYAFYPLDVAYDFAPFTPMQAYKLLETDEGKNFFSSIRKVILGGSAVNADLELMIKPLGNAVYSTYGMTETVSHIALRALNGPNASEEYFALEGVSFSLDEQACLQIHMKGQPSLSTLDVVELKGRHHMRFLGRLDNRINSGGIKLYPELIEAKINRSLHSPNNFFLFGMEDECLGQKLCLLEEVAEGEQPFFNKVIQAKIKASLKAFEMPKAFYHVPVFSYTKNQKIQRSQTINNFLSVDK